MIRDNWVSNFSFGELLKTCLRTWLANAVCFCHRPGVRLCLYLSLSLLLVVTQLARAAKPLPVFEAATIDADIEIGYGLAIADVDGDGKQDILLADKGEIVWYANPTWQKHVVARKLTLRDNVCLAAADIDGDGKCEIAVGANWNPSETTSEKASSAVFYLTRPEDSTQLWGSVQLPHEPTVHRMHWLVHRNSARLVALPLHGRENKAGEGEDGSRILSYTPPRKAADITNPENWKIEPLEGELHQTHNFDIGVGGGYDGTVVVGGSEGLFQTGGALPEYLFKAEDFDGFEGIGEVRCGPRYTFRGSDIPMFTTIEPIHGNQVVVYELATSNGDEWVFDREVLDTSLNQGHALACADLLGLDRQQILAGWRKADADGNTGIRLYHWSEQDDAWKTHTLDRNDMACEDLKVADLDGDGKLDVIACGRSSKNVKIYWNRSELGSKPALTGAAGWKKHVVWEATKGGGPPAASAGDYDGDGHMDIIFGLNDGEHLLPGPDFSENILVRKKTPGQAARGIHCTTMDVDGDGDLDYVGGARSVYWTENPGGADARGAWTYHDVDKEISGVHCVLPADVDGDGDLDLLANEFSDKGPVPNSITWQDQTTAADGSLSWARMAFAAGDAPGGNHYMGFGDIDGDGFGDVACGAKGRPFLGGNWFAWWKNPGGDAMRNQPWKKIVLADGMIGATCILTGDLDGDGDTDLFATRGHGSGVLWFRNEGKAESWEQIEIDSRLSRPHCLCVADLDGDGDMDGATCSSSADRRAVWFENDGKGNFTVHDIDDDQQAYNIVAEDMDGDGDLDLLIGGHGAGNVVWYENVME